MSPAKAPTDGTVVEISAPAALGNYKVYNRIIDWISNDRMQLSNITDRINDVVRKSGVRDGMVHLQTLHTTTAVFINEWQDALLHDVRGFFEKIVDAGDYYRHNDPEHSDCERRNADAHMRGMLMGQTLCLQVRNATVLLGTWQSIIFAEFDGPGTVPWPSRFRASEPGPAMNRHFTVEQAEALLPQVESAIRDAIELKRFYEEAEEILQSELRRIQFSGGAAVDSMRVRAEKSRRDTCAARLNEAIERIHSYGCEVKDLDIGLIDFRTLYNGREVYLCWKLGEAGITHWHGLEEGFRGRKVIDGEFLKAHRGALA